MSNPTLRGRAARTFPGRRMLEVQSWLGSLVSAYLERRRLAAELERLDERMLRDIGLERDTLRLLRLGSQREDWRDR